MKKKLSSQRQSVKNRNGTFVQRFTHKVLTNFFFCIASIAILMAAVLTVVLIVAFSDGAYGGGSSIDLNIGDDAVSFGVIIGLTILALVIILVTFITQIFLSKKKGTKGRG